MYLKTANITAQEVPYFDSNLSHLTVSSEKIILVQLYIYKQIIPNG